MLPRRSCILWMCVLVLFSGVVSGVLSQEEGESDAAAPDVENVEDTSPAAQDGDDVPEAEVASEAPTDDTESDEGDGQNDDQGEEEEQEEQEQVDFAEAEITEPTSAPASDVTSEPDVDYEITTSDGDICIRAHFQISFRIKYAGMIGKKLHVRETNIMAPATEAGGLTVTGSCEDDPRSLTLSWNQGNFSVNFQFSHQVRDNPNKGEVGSEGSATSAIKFTLNTRDNKYFSNPLNPGTYTTSTAPKRNHFWMPTNSSFLCDTKQRVILLEYNDKGNIIEQNVVKVMMWISQAQIQAFDIGQDGQFREATVCEADIYNNMPKTNIIPIVVAACLACLIILIIIIYFVSKNVGMGAYRSME